MNRIVLSIIGCIVAFNVFALSISSDGRAWNRASAKERDSFARDVVGRLGAKYPAAEMRACLDSFYVSPAPDNILAQEIGQIAVLCHTQLK